MLWKSPGFEEAPSEYLIPMLAPTNIQCSKPFGRTRAPVLSYCGVAIFFESASGTAAGPRAPRKRAIGRKATTRGRNRFIGAPRRPAILRPGASVWQAQRRISTRRRAAPLTRPDEGGIVSPLRRLPPQTRFEHARVQGSLLRSRPAVSQHQERDRRYDPDRTGEQPVRHGPGPEAVRAGAGAVLRHEARGGGELG